MVTPDPHAAPGSLETVRSLLNSWWVPNDTRAPRDDLDVWLAEHGVSDRGPLERLRGELRELVEAPVAIDAVVNRWIRRYQIGLRANGGQLEISATSDRPGAGLALAVIAAMQEGTFARLKACPDCRWAFYDHSRNNSKRWCVMNASDPAGRSCGNLAKAHRYRSRHRGARSEP